MLVILKKNVRKLGIKGAVVKVKGGYARNYLIPHKEAVAANEANMLELKKNQAILDQQNIELLKKAQLLAETNKELTLSVVRKANVLDGKLFGSIMVRDIVQELSKHNIDVGIKDVVLPQIKYIGDYHVEVSLHPDVALKIPLSVQAS